MALEHFASTSAWRSWSVKCKHVKSAPIWTSDMLLVKIKDKAEAISSAVGFVEGDSCQSLLRRGVMEILDSASANGLDIVL